MSADRQAAPASDAGVHAALERKAASELAAGEPAPGRYARFEAAVVGGLAFAALALCSYNVFVRWFHPAATLELVEEVQVYLIVWAVFVSLGSVTLTDRHVKADLFVSMLPAPLARALAVFADVLGLGFTLLLVWYGVAIAYQAWDYGDVSITSLRFPLWIYIAALPAGALMMAIAHAMRLAGGRRTQAGSPHP